MNPTDKPMNSDTEDAAATAMAEACPDPDERRAAFQALVEAVAVADALGARTWALTRLENGYRLNVGPIEVQTMMDGMVRLLLLGSFPRATRDPPDTEPYEGYAHAPTGTTLWYGTPLEWRRHRALLAPLHAAFIRAVAVTLHGKPYTTPYLRHHSEALYRYALAVVASPDDEAESPRRARKIPIQVPAARLLATVLELHKRGHQHIRILPYLSASGMHWRCEITIRDNVESNGYSPKTSDEESGITAFYSSADDDRYFGWTETDRLSIPELADKFAEKYPKIVNGGRGRDWAYTGWLAEVLGQAEHPTTPHLVSLISDSGPSDEYLAKWSPPPLLDQ